MELCPSLFLSFKYNLVYIPSRTSNAFRNKTKPKYYMKQQHQLLHFLHNQRREKCVWEGKQKKGTERYEEEFHGIIPSDNQS